MKTNDHLIPKSTINYHCHPKISGNQHKLIQFPLKASNVQHVKLYKLMDSRYRPIADAVLQAEVPGHVDNLRVEGGGDEEPRHQDVSVTRQH